LHINSVNGRVVLNLRKQVVVENIKPKPKNQMLAKYDYFKTNVYINNVPQNYTVGINYLPIKNIRLQLNYFHKVNKDKEREFVVAQLWVKF
jgi:phosphate-selective porin